MKLQQGQIWHTHPDIHGHGSSGLYLRIVHLERLAVEYKEFANLDTKEGKHKTATKKQFCRMIKNATEVSS